MSRPNLAKVCLFIGAIFCLTPYVSSGTALLLGLALALSLGNPFLKQTKLISGRLLQLSVIGLGAGMNLAAIAKAGSTGFLYTVIGIFLTLLVGTWLGKLLKTRSTLSLLLNCGTAICGGSAIAAVASTVQADDKDISLSLVTVFFLNAVALFLFPAVGHLLNLSEVQFGYWCALAIHDTSSVVGASLAYGHHALELATVIKLARALWIIPLTLGVGILYRRQRKSRKTKWPWFILGFVGMAAVVTLFPAFEPAGRAISEAAKHMLVLTLFLIGANMPRGSLKNVELRRAVAQGTLLWAFIATSTLSAILAGWIH